MPLDFSPSLSTTLVEGFASSVLPETMAVAETHRSVLEDMIKCTPRIWSFEDRVLAWLVPGLEREIVYFHAGRGPSMATRFSGHQVAHLDSDFCATLRLKLQDLSKA